MTSVATILLALGATASIAHAANDTHQRIERAVDAAIRPLMAQYDIAGMAVGITIAGRTEVFDYGVASRETGKPVTRDTLFEIGSISKTFTATLAAFAETNGALSLSDTVGQSMPSLRGRPFGDVRLRDLATHTPGGLPLQVPDRVHDDGELIAYLAAWKPAYARGTRRTYSNPGIGMLGLITGRRMTGDFAALMDRDVFSPLNMRDTTYDVSAARAANYAQGYAKTAAPVRLTRGVLAFEAYGVKSTAADMLRFVDANMNPGPQDNALQRAIAATHTGYYEAGPMTQDLIWEQYRYPVALKTLLEGNGPSMIFDATPVTEIVPPRPPLQAAWINKTGSTNGFGAYVAFVPAKRLGIVILANRNLPIEARVAAAYRIVTALADEAASSSAVSHRRTSNSSW